MNNKNNEERDLTYYRELQYDFVVKKKGDHFITFIPELAIVARGETFDEAYEKINAQKEAYFQEMIETGNDDYINEPAGRKTIKKILDIPNIIGYVVKLMLTIIIIASLGIVGIGGIFGEVTSKFGEITTKAIGEINIGEIAKKAIGEIKIGEIASKAIGDITSKAIVEIKSIAKREIQSIAEGEINADFILKNLRTSSYSVLDKINDLPKERQEEIRLKLRTAIKQIQPILGEFRPLFKVLLEEAPEKGELPSL
jgi:histone H3/H4